MYVLIKWQIAYLAKEYGGLGILDLRQMNIVLLMKLWWKFQDQTYIILRKTITKYKYYSNSDIPYSAFW